MLRQNSTAAVAVVVAKKICEKEFHGALKILFAELRRNVYGCADGEVTSRGDVQVCCGKACVLKYALFLL